MIEGRPARRALYVFAVVLAIHLGAQLAPADTLANATQWALMPLIANVVRLATSAPRARLVRLASVALGFSWLGDLLPDLVGGPAAFFALIGMFALAQATYVVAFWPYRAAGLLRRPWVVGYVAYAIALVALCAPGAGPLAPAVVIYAALITGMAVLATGVHRLAGVGALLFLISDSLIALEIFVPAWEVVGQSFWVMSTYAVAQFLIALGVLRASGHPAPRGAPAT